MRLVDLVLLVELFHDRLQLVGVQLDFKVDLLIRLVCVVHVVEIFQHLDLFELDEHLQLHLVDLVL